MRLDRGMDRTALHNALAAPFTSTPVLNGDAPFLTFTERYRVAETLAPVVEEMLAPQVEMAAKLLGIEALHYPDDSTPGYVVCDADEQTWPCRTARILAGEEP